MKTLLLSLIAICTLQFANAQDSSTISINVKIEGISENKGSLIISLFNSEETYLNEPLSYYRWHDSNLSHKKFRLNILELIRWKNKLSKDKRFFSSQNLINIEDHLIYLISLYFKKKKSKINLILFLKNTKKIKNKLLIVIIFFLPMKLFNLIRS